ncbi:riboflavin biosynthesis protein RibF [Halobacillus sp. ACCC02827]|uniref:riboflavin biosynthesis protein RibF n=1 Tax=Bacillaceae TaxID=186817 RepID=UPI0002A4E77C|nr:MULTISPECIES: riboflavin biosynthesis protein RibF [Bacillaceae]ELK47500.1 bifunctional riboflavin kinase / FMN adenylyltransferase [Halobacillus sp. BAB-2008]WJE16018.1 riboflavin biosynthesis protein RibF [Halobacillus sp. ACCC02827]
METIEVTGRPPESSEPKVLIIGKMDGVHLGHQALLREAKSLAAEGEKLAVYAFSDHPKWVLRGDEAFKASLSTDMDKQRYLKAYGVELYYHVHFTKEYAKTSPEEFVLEHLNRLNIRHVVVGEDFRFGKGRGSDAEGLKELCASIDIGVSIVPGVLMHGDKVSSTDIRNHVMGGRMEAAQSMLGRPFEVTGVVEKGQQLGRTLGYPTLNVGGIDAYVNVKPAVYLGTVQIGWDKPEYHYTLISAGYRPTVNGDSYKVEAYLLDFSGDLYGREVTVQFLRHLRDEVNFNGMDALVEQMKHDEEEARSILGLA